MIEEFGVTVLLTTFVFLLSHEEPDSDGGSNDEDGNEDPDPDVG